MKIAYLYLIGRLVKIILLTFIVIILLTMISSLFGGVDFAGDTETFIYNLLKLAPFLIYDMMPLACVVGIVLGLRSIINSNELTILKGMGLSWAKLAALIALPALFLGLISYVWMDFVAVPLYKLSTDKLGGESIQLNNLWLNYELPAGQDEAKRDVVVYIDRLAKNEGSPTELSATNIYLFGYEGKELKSYSHGGKVSFQPDGSWQEQISVNWPSSDKTWKVGEFKISATALIENAKDRRSQNMYELWRGEIDNKAANQSNNIKMYEIWHRLSLPLLFVSASLLMLAFSLMTPPRSSAALQVVIALAMGMLMGPTFRSIAFYTAVANPAYLWAGSLLPPLILAGISLIYIYKHS